MEHITREEAYDLLKKYNKDPFHIQHALTVETVMKWYAEELGFGADAEYWGIVGLLHDIEEAYDLLKKYNKDPFHIQHALTVETVMKWYAEELGFGADAEYWGIVGLLHDIDFELYPEEHCIKAPELLREGGVGEDIIHGVVSHGYGITVDVAPEHEMEKVLFAADELTGLIWAAALMRPSKSTKDMELKSLKKKYKSKGFAAGCSREVIERGAEQLGWELDKLLTMTLEAMKATEDEINAEIEK